MHVYYFDILCTLYLEHHLPRNIVLPCQYRDGDVITYFESGYKTTVRLGPISTHFGTCSSILITLKEPEVLVQRKSTELLQQLEGIFVIAWFESQDEIPKRPVSAFLPNRFKLPLDICV